MTALIVGIIVLILIGLLKFFNKPQKCPSCRSGRLSFVHTGIATRAGFDFCIDCGWKSEKYIVEY